MRIAFGTAALVSALVALTAPAWAGVVKSTKVGTSVVALSTKSGSLTSGKNDITIAVTDEKGGAKSATITGLNIYMPPMGGMPGMKADAKLQPAKAPGVYTGTLDIDMKGTWIVRVNFKDGKGSHRATFNVVAK